jgi:hypothetical protein
MKTLVFVAAVALCATDLAMAANPSCDAQATEKKLAGAAKTSFVKKCVKDAADTAAKDCNTQAADKKLAGAAKTSFVKKCVTDATEAK